jgi:two-component system response regulator
MQDKRPVVLCVDNNPDNQLLVLDTLLDINPHIKVASALNGAEAMSFLYGARGRKELPCLVLLDSDMSLMDGRQGLLLLIKKDEELSSVPVVLFASAADGTDPSLSGLQGVELVTRPFSQQELYGTISRLLNSCRK